MTEGEWKVERSMVITRLQHLEEAMQAVNEKLWMMLLAVLGLLVTAAGSLIFAIINFTLTRSAT